MRRILYFLLLYCLFVPPLVAQESEGLRKLLNTSGLKRAAIGISVKRVSDGKSVCTHDPEISLTPASVTKLFSTALALQKVGPAYTFQTVLAYSGEIRDGVLKGNIIIESGGDPSLDSRYFPSKRFVDKIVTVVKELGIRKIEGDIVILGKEEENAIPGSWLWEDVANYYGALYHAFNYRDNLYTIDLKPDRGTKTAKIASIVPALPGIEFVNQVTVSDLKNEDVWIYGGPYTRKLLLKGNITTKSPFCKIKGAMHEPSSVCRAELKTRLSKQGIIVEGRRLRDEAKQVLHTFVSPTVEEIVFYTNKRSINLFAEAMGQLVRPVHFEREAKERLAAISIDTSGLILKDACGLSMQNAAPAEVFTDLLIWGRKHLGKPFWASLPEGGVDGGLAIYADHPVLQNNLRAKTGSFTGVRALSGYLTTRHKQELAFTILINHYTCTPKELQEAVRNFLVELSEFLE